MLLPQHWTCSSSTEMRHSTCSKVENFSALGEQRWTPRTSCQLRSGRQNNSQGMNQHLMSSSCVLRMSQALWGDRECTTVHIFPFLSFACLGIEQLVVTVLSCQEYTLRCGLMLQMLGHMHIIYSVCSSTQLLVVPGISLQVSWMLYW